MDEKDEYVLDEINGCKGRKPKLSILNKKDLSPQEMDALFLE